VNSDTWWPFFTRKSGEPRPQPGGQDTITGPDTLPGSDDIDKITAANTIANTKSNNEVFASNDIGTDGATGTQSWPDTTATIPAKTTGSSPGRKKEVSFAPESKGTTKFGDQWSAEERERLRLESLSPEAQKEFLALTPFRRGKLIKAYMKELGEAAESAPSNKKPLNEWAIMEASRKQTKHVRDVLTTTGLAPSVQTIQSVARTLMGGALEELGYEADTLTAFKWDEVEPGWRDKAKACPDANWLTLGNEHDKKVWFEQMWKPRNPSTKTDEEAFKDFERQTKGTMFQVKPDDPIYSQLSAFGGGPAPLDFDTLKKDPKNLQKLQTMMDIETKTKADGGDDAAVDKAWEDALGPRPPPTSTGTDDGVPVENVQGTPSETTTAGEPKDGTAVTSEQGSKTTTNLPVNTNMNNPFAPTEYDYEVAKSVKWTERLTEYNAIMEKRAADKKKAEAELAQKIAEAKEAKKNPFKIVLGPSKNGATSLGSLMSDSASTTPHESLGTSVPLSWSGHRLDEWIKNIKTEKKKLTEAAWQTIADRAYTYWKNDKAISKHFPSLGMSFVKACAHSM
jgi:Spy/CpxP family protein refolding chaperone